MRNKGFNQYRNRMTNQIIFWKAMTIMGGFMILVLILGYSYKNWQDAQWKKHLVSPIPLEVHASEPAPTPTPTPVPEPSVENVMAYIGRKDKFGKFGAFTAAKASMCFVTEGMASRKDNKSMVDTRRMNWNCKYGDVYTSCAPQDRDQAWSVDCGVAQINVSGKVCPEDLFDYQKNIDVAVKKYEARGNFSAWYGTGCK